MKKLLSPHEIAVLLVLFSAPGQVPLADPDAIILQQELLAEVVETSSAGTEYRLTPEGKALLQRLGIRHAATPAAPEAGLSRRTSSSATC